MMLQAMVAASLNQKIVKTKDYQYEKSLITLIQIRSL